MVFRIEAGPGEAREMALQPIPLCPELTPVGDPAIAEMRALYDRRQWRSRSSLR
jgi:hypothetical protein